MALDPWMDRRYRELAMSTGNWMKEHRERIALEESQRLERKQHELLEQASEHNSPTERIRIWERRHALTLPRDPNHPVLVIVADATHLTVDQVQEEQQRRLGAVKTAAITPTPG